MVSLRWIPKAESEILFFSRAGLSYLGSSGLCLSGGSMEPHALEEHRPVASPQNFVLCEHTPLGEKELRDGTKQAHLPLLHIMSFWQNPVRKLVCPPCWGHSWSLGNSSFSTTTQTGFKTEQTSNAFFCKSCKADFQKLSNVRGTSRVLLIISFLYN